MKSLLWIALFGVSLTAFAESPSPKPEAEQTVADTAAKTEEKRPEEAKTAEAKPEEPKTDEKKAEETKGQPAETAKTDEEKKADGDKKEETKTAEAKSEEKKPEEKKAEDKPAEAKPKVATPKVPPVKKTYVAGKARTVTVLVGSDTSGYNLASALQFALGQLYKTAGNDFTVQQASMALAAFTEEETRKAHQTLNSDLFSLAYLDRERISIFLFDVQAPGQFIVGVNPLLDPGVTQLTTAVLENKLRKTFTETLALYKEGRFQYLPGSREDKAGEGLADAETDLARRKAAEAGHLFRELASLADKPFFIGANLGMARYADSGLANSVVNIGGFAGYRIRERISAELALDVFTYGLLSFDAKYQLPISGQYVYLDVSLGAGTILFRASDNFGHENATLPGGFLFGPGVTFTVPLLGAHLRGGLKFYMGSGSILVGSYGFSYGVTL